jgi:phytoene dehydrogenase-like protein
MKLYKIQTIIVQKTSFICYIKYLSENSSLPEKPLELMKIGDYMELGRKMGPFLKVMNKYKKFTVKEFTSKFVNREIAFILSNIISIEDFQVFALMSMLGEYDKKNAGWPEGGALSFAGSLEKKYKGLGGKIFYKSKVKEIITGNGLASGIILENRSTIKGDIIISSADLHFTMHKLLKGKYKDYDRMFDKETLWTPLVMASIGVNKEVRSVPETDIRIGEFKFGDIPVEGVWIRNFGFDTSLNQPGKTSIIASFESDFDFWQNLISAPGKYENQKEMIAKDIISYLEKAYPEIKSAFEVVDIATPFTTFRYTGNYKGSYEGWRYTKRNFGKNVRKFIPKLGNFYLCGQWVVPGGGIPAVSKCAKDVIEIIDDKVRKGRARG